MIPVTLPASPAVGMGAAAAFGKRLGQLRRRLARDNSAVAFVEFALSAPVVLTMGLLGTETAYFVIAHMQVSQLAMQVADNVSRVGEQDVLTARRVFDSDINESFVGAEKLGANLGIFDRGRVIVSSLQRNGQGGQWIAWQRCRGAKNHTSSFGLQGTGATGTSFAGMGRPGNLITASPGTAVIFVEVAYDYRSLTPFQAYNGNVITYTAAFNIRDSRDLTQLYDDGPTATCNVFSAARPT
jgi:Flp pilus assembly protein TadG